MPVITEKTKKIPIVGLPNTGKSHVFSHLTQKYVLSGNYSYTTVDVCREHCDIEGERYEVIDTPPLHCIYSQSEEEIMVRDIMLKEEPDVVVQCIDANRLKQSLMLTFDLLEMGLPTVISLNAIGETAKKGLWIDTEKLSQLMGTPVIESVATKGIGIGDLKKVIPKAKRSNFREKYGDQVENGIEEIADVFPEELSSRRKIAVLMMQGDPFIGKYIEDRFGKEVLDRTVEVKSRQGDFGGNVNWSINGRKHKWIDNIVEQVVGHHQIKLGGKSEMAAKWSRHPVFGFMILIGVLTVMLFSVVNVANYIAGWMNDSIWLPIEHRVGTWVTHAFWNDFLIGDYGILTLGVSNAILTVLPILAVFFLLFSILEDSGYMPNMCVLMKRVTDKIGLTGNSVMPLTLAFGCKTMATLSSKSIKSRREKFLVVYLIAFGIPCAAQMGLNMSILGKLGIKAFFIAFSFLGTLWLLVGLTLNRLLKEEAKDFFLFELPKMRFPHIGSVLKKTLYKLKDFLREALPVFVSAAIILFFADRFGILDALKTVLKPVITRFLGFPIQMVDVLILCMAKHEAAAGLLIKMVQRGELNYVQIIVAVTLTMMFVPCLANIMAMIRVKGVKNALLMVLTINITAILMAGLLNWMLLTAGM